MIKSPPTSASRRTLITWSRKLQFEIQNARALELERLQYECGASPEDRARASAAELQRVLAVLKTRDLASLSTSRLYSLADSFRRQIIQSTGNVHFTTPVVEIPREERIERVHDWSA